MGDEMPSQSVVSPARDRQGRVVAALSVVAIVQSVVLLAMTLALMWTWFGPSFWDSEAVEFEEGPDYYSVAEEAAWDVDSLLDEGDVAGYLALYAPDDPSVDALEVRRAFEDSRADLGDGAVDVTVGMTKVLEDQATGEIIVRVGLEAVGASGPSEKLTVYVLHGEPSLTLTGIEGRELTQVEVVSY